MSGSRLDLFFKSITSWVERWKVCGTPRISTDMQPSVVNTSCELGRFEKVFQNDIENFLFFIFSKDTSSSSCLRVGKAVNPQARSSSRLFD